MFEGTLKKNKRGGKRGEIPLFEEGYKYEEENPAKETFTVKPVNEKPKIPIEHLENKTVKVVKEPQNDPYKPLMAKKLSGERYYEMKKQDDLNKKIDDNIVKRMEEMGKAVSGKTQPMMNLQFFPQQEKKEEKKKQNFDILNSFHPMFMGQPLIQPPQIIKNPILNKNIYNIHAGPHADHEKVNRIYEDVYPSKVLELSYKTLQNRRIIKDKFIGFLNVTDGATIPLNGAETGLLNHLQLLKFNPFSTDPFIGNPYANIQDGILIYSSCHPMTYDTKQNKSVCSKNSTGVNVRMYDYSVLTSTGARNTARINRFNDELAYYRHIDIFHREKKCPNFINFYTHTLTVNSKIDFNKVATIRATHLRSLAPVGTATGLRLQKTGGKKTKEKKKKGGFGGVFYATPVIAKPTVPVAPVINPVDVFTYITETNNIAGRDSIKTLTTESPTYSLKMWLTNQYVDDGGVDKLIFDANHSNSVILSVMFQLWAALYCLKKNPPARLFKITLDNVYIKDCKAYDDEYWTYEIEGFKFYVPNEGYQVVIDSNYFDYAPVVANQMLDAVFDSTYITNIRPQLRRNGFVSVDFDVLFSVNVGGLTRDIKGTEEAMWIFRKYLHNRVGKNMSSKDSKNIDFSTYPAVAVPGNLGVIYEYPNYKYIMYVSATKYFDGNTVKDIVSGGITADIRNLYSQKIPQDDSEIRFNSIAPIETYKF